MKSVTIFSCVGGGPMERLATSLRSHEIDATLDSWYPADEWRRLMSGSSASRLQARATSMVLYPLRSTWRAWRSPSRTLIVTTNPFFLPPLLISTRGLHGHKTIALLYDLYPDALDTLSGERPVWFKKAFGAFNRWWLSRADLVVFIGRRMATVVQSRYGEMNHAVIETGAVVSEFDDSGQPSCETARWLADGFGVSYVGNMGHVHDVDTLRDALSHLDPMSSASELRLAIAASGPGVQEFRQFMIESSSDSVRVMSPLPDADWRDVLSATRLAVVTLKSEAVDTSLPSKVFSAMAAQCAILAICPRSSDLAELVSTTDCGFVVEPGNVHDLVRLLVRLQSDPALVEAKAANALRAMRERYDLDRLAEHWLSIL